MNSVIETRLEAQMLSALRAKYPSIVHLPPGVALKGLGTIGSLQSLISRTNSVTEIMQKLKTALRGHAVYAIGYYSIDTEPFLMVSLSVITNTGKSAIELGAG